MASHPTTLELLTEGEWDLLIEMQRREDSGLARTETVVRLLLHEIANLREENGKLQAATDPQEIEALRTRATRAGAVHRIVTPEGYIQLPARMVREVAGPQGGVIWFLQHGEHWTAWPEHELEAALDGAP